MIKLQALGLQLYQKETATQLFVCEYCKNFKNAYFEEPLRKDAFEVCKNLMKTLFSEVYSKQIEFIGYRLTVLKPFII